MWQGKEHDDFMKFISLTGGISEAPIDNLLL